MYDGVKGEPERNVQSDRHVVFQAEYWIDEYDSFYSFMAFKSIAHIL